MIYLDNAASTPPAPEVLETMARAAAELYGNPSSAHGLGAAAARALAAARQQVADSLGGAPGEIVFTSGGTEADALGLLGAANVARGRHVVVSAIEHPAVLRSAELLAARGFEITHVAPRPTGVVSADEVVAATRPDTAVVAVMLVNNELGTVQPVAGIARGLRAAGYRAHFHVDAVQAFGLLPVCAPELGADTVAISAHKFHGPKGAGALWVRSGRRLGPLWDGGRQEGGLRSGTENVPGWIGLAKAAELCTKHLQAGATARVTALRDRLETAVLAAVPSARLTIAGAPRAPHVSSIAFPGLPAEPLLHALEARGVVVSAGSACASRSKEPSATLKAIGIDERTAVLRFSLSRDTQPEHIETAARELAAAASEIARAIGAGAGR